MSKSELERFSNDISSDTALQDSVKGVSPDAEALIKLAAEKGYDFTQEEFMEQVADHEGKSDTELNDEELSQVAGGLRPHLHCLRWF